MALNGFEAALKMRRDARQEALDYDALIQRAQALGIPTYLMDEFSTVAELLAEVEAAEAALTVTFQVHADHAADQDFTLEGNDAVEWRAELASITADPDVRRVVVTQDDRVIEEWVR